MARRIFAELPQNSKRIQCLIPSGGRLDSLAVMRELFETLRYEFHARIFDHSLTVDPLEHPSVNLTHQLIEKIRLFESDVQTAKLTLEKSDAESLEASLETGGSLSLLMKFLLKVQTNRTEKNSLQVSLRPPTPIDLAEVCGVMVETLLNLNLVRHALILVDDVDLLGAYVTPEQNARNQRSLLADAINHLHATPAVDVVLTARSWYKHSRKELQTLIDLEQSPPITADDLKQIHDCRLELYGNKKWPCPFLTEDALRELASDAHSLPGVFLQHLNSAFYQFQNEDGWEQRDYKWLLGVFRRHFDGFRDKCAPALQVIEEALANGNQTIDVSQNNPFSGTVLDNEFVYQSYYSETTYFTSGLLGKILRPLIAETTLKNS